MALPSTFHIKRILKQFYNNPLTLDEICNTINTVDTSGSENASNDPAYVVSGYGGVPCQKDKGNKRRSALTELMKWKIAPALNLDELTVNGSAKYMTVKAIAAWQSDHLKESLLILDSIIFTDDMNPLLASFILIIKAKIQFLFKDYKDSVNTYEKAIKKCPSNTDIYVHRGMDYVVSFELELAMKDFHMAISLCINNTSAVVQNCALLIRMAKLNRRQNYMPEALLRFRNAVERFPDDVNVQIGYAESLSFLGMYRKAGEVLSSALRLDSCNPWIYLAQGRLYQKRKEMEKSISCLHDNLKLDPSCVEAYYMLGCMEIERNNPEVGVSLYKKGIKFATCRAHVYKLTEMFLKAQVKIEIVRNHSK